MRRNYTELPGSSNTVQANWVDNGVDPTEDMPLLRGQQAPTEVANDEDISCYQRYCPGKIQSNMTMDTALSAVKYTVFILIDAHPQIHVHPSFYVALMSSNITRDVDMHPELMTDNGWK